LQFAFSATAQPEGFVKFRERDSIRSVIWLQGYGCFQFEFGQPPRLRIVDKRPPIFSAVARATRFDTRGFGKEPERLLRLALIYRRDTFLKARFPATVRRRVLRSRRTLAGRPFEADGDAGAANCAS